MTIDWGNLAMYVRSREYLLGVSHTDRRAWRDRAGIHRAELAGLLNCSVATLRSWETSTTPSGPEAYRYSQVLSALAPTPTEALPPEEQEKIAGYYQAHFEDHPPAVCEHCGGVHTRACPRVKALSYHENGRTAHVEYWPHNEWPKDDVVFVDGKEMQHDEG